MNEIQSIDTLTTEILMLKQQTAQNIIEIGKRLITVKESLPHGEWGKWLKEKVDFTDRTAQRFMKVANEISNATALSDLPKSKVFALLDLPQEEREEFIQNNPVDEMTTRELQQAIREKKELEDKLKAAEVKIKKSADKVAKVESEKNKIKEKITSVEAKWKEDLVNREAEIENLKIHIDKIKNQMTAAESSGNGEELEKLQLSLQEKENSIFEANKKIEELEQKLKEKPIEVISSPEVIEKVPEEIEKELHELREKVKRGSGSDVSMVKFKVQFDELVKNFKGLLETLEILPGDEVRGKYKAAVKGLINKMSENL